MRLSAWILALGCCLGLLLGCGGSESSPADPPACTASWSMNNRPRPSSLAPKSWIVLEAPELFIPTYADGSCDYRTPDEDATASAKPFSYQWKIEEYPQYAGTLHLLNAEAAEDNTDYVEGRDWSTDLAKVKFYAAEAGRYEFALSAQDAFGRLANNRNRLLWIVVIE